VRGSHRQKIASASSADSWEQDDDQHADEGAGAPAAPLTAEQAQQLRGRIRQVSPWWIVGAQAGAGLLAAWIAGAWTGNAAIGWSVAWGALAVALPAGVFARALRRGAGSMVLLWEWVKLGLTVALLLASPRVVPGLDWLALLAGVILATKMYWVAFVFARRRRLTGN
jgi:ATP synthase protein I